MPMTSVTLRPGVDVEKTPSLNEAGISQSQLIRFKGGLTQTYGGWESYGTVIPSTVKDLHPWQDIAGIDHLSAAAVSNVIVVTSGVGVDITPQTLTSCFSPNFTSSAGNTLIRVDDPNSGASIYNSVFFNTQVAIGGVLLQGAYQVAQVLSTGAFTIMSSIAASSTVVNGGTLPSFTTSSGSGVVTVVLPNNNYQAGIGLNEAFYAPTSVGGLTIQGPYQISSVIDSTSFTITAPSQASSAATATMNSTIAQLRYYITGGPVGAGTGYGTGGYGTGPWGGLGGGFAAATGTPITAQDWSQDNWGEILLNCPKDGPIYLWAPDSGFTNEQVIPEAPFFNGGIFTSMPQQILVAWRSTLSTGVQDNLVVRWSDALNFRQWDVNNQTTAGSFRIPTGSIIVGGLQAPTYGVIWTDLDAWLMQYIGGDIIFNFTRVGTGCGLIGPHAAGVLAGNVYWCGTHNFFQISSGSVQAIPCTVWDFIFQNLNQANAHKVVCAPNSVFNEITWFFPSANATENDSYVKLNIVEGTWDYGSMSRTAWTDVSVIGNPIGADTAGVLYQHETGETITGAGLPSFRTGWWAISEGNDLAFVDYVIPDFKFGFFTEPTDATVSITFFSADYPGDSPVTYGPYTVTSATEYLTPRIRGRLMSVLVQSVNSEFWRLGRIRYRWAPAGRR